MSRIKMTQQALPEQAIKLWTASISSVENINPVNFQTSWDIWNLLWLTVKSSAQNGPKSKCKVRHLVPDLGILCSFCLWISAWSSLVDEMIRNAKIWTFRSWRTCIFSSWVKRHGRASDTFHHQEDSAKLETTAWLWCQTENPSNR